MARTKHIASATRKRHATSTSALPVALRDIWKLEKNLEQLIPTAPFIRTVREISNILAPKITRWTAEALVELQEASADYLIKLSQYAMLCAIRARRVTLRRKAAALSLAKNIGTTANGGVDGSRSPGRNEDENDKTLHPHTGNGERYSMEVWPGRQLQIPWKTKPRISELLLTEEEQIAVDPQAEMKTTTTSLFIPMPAMEVAPERYSLEVWPGRQLQVEIKKPKPIKPNPPPPSSKRYGNLRASFGGGFEDAYGGRGGAGFGAGPHRSGGAYGARASSYGGADLGGYGRLGDSFGGYGGAGGGYRAGYDVGLKSGYGGAGATGYGGRYGGVVAGSMRHHPYGR